MTSPGRDGPFMFPCTCFGSYQPGNGLLKDPTWLYCLKKCVWQTVSEYLIKHPSKWKDIQLWSGVVGIGWWDRTVIIILFFCIRLSVVCNSIFACSSHRFSYSIDCLRYYFAFKTDRNFKLYWIFIHIIWSHKGKESLTFFPIKTVTESFN